MFCKLCTGLGRVHGPVGSCRMRLACYFGIEERATQMATMEERARQVWKVNPTNEPMHPNQLAKIWFADMVGFDARPANHNGGLRKGPTVALGLAARMAKKKIMVRWVDPRGFLRGSYWQLSAAFIKAEAEAAKQNETTGST